MAAIRVGFVGAGGIANAHMNALLLLDDVQIAAVADSSEERARIAASRFMANPYTDYRELLDSEELDALYVCVPPFAHEQQEVIAASKGIHLFVEKPVALSMEKAREIRDAIRESGIITSVGYHWRYQSNVVRAKELLKDREISMILGYWMGTLPDISWWLRMEKSGGQMVEQTTHIFDLARHICGEVKEVYAAFGHPLKGRGMQSDIYGVGTATLKFENGMVGQISNTCILDFPYTVGLHVVANDLVVEVHGDLKVREAGHTEVFTSAENSILEENKAFINAIRTGDTSIIRSTYEDAVKTLAVTLACNEAASTGKPVKVSA